MKNAFNSVCLLVLFSAQPAMGQEITDQSFVGQWCGQWDGIYSFCLTIDTIDSDAIAKYRWLEHPEGKFKKKTKRIERVNLNTLKIDNIWLALDEKNLGQANAMGIFRYRSRVAILKKEEPAN